MKNIFVIITFSLLSFSTFAKIGHIPKSWLASNDNLKSVNAIATSDELHELEQSYQNILEHKQNLIESLDQPLKPEFASRKWFLQSIKTEIGIEVEGEIGITVGGESAVELVWIKKADDHRNGSSGFVENEPNNESININAQMSQELLEKEITPIVDLAMKSGKVKRRERFFTNLFSKALEFQKTIKEIESAPQMGPWYAYKYQLELYVSVEGHVSVFALGNSMRLRMEWWRLKPKASQLSNLNQITNLSKNAQYILALTQDASQMNQNLFSNGFKLNAMKVGIGTTIEGNIFVAQAKTQAIGALFLARQENTPAPLLKGINELSVSKLDPELTFFRKGLIKGAQIASFFANHAKTKEDGKFELQVIETEFIFITGGSIGLVTVEGNALLSLFVTKNVSI